MDQLFYTFFSILRLEQYLNNYTVIDLETCGIDAERRNHVIELSAIRIRNGNVIEEFSSLVNPLIKIPEEVVRITGISDAMVSSALPIDQLLSRYLSFIGDDVVVGYNINTFDYNILYDLSLKLLHTEFSNDFVDLQYGVKRKMNSAELPVENCRLSTVCGYFNIDATGAHRALADCYLTKNLYDCLYDRFGLGIFHGRTYEVEQGQPKERIQRFSDETIRLQELQNILDAILEDEKVYMEEVIALDCWMKSNINLRGNYPFDRVYNLLERVLSDGVIDQDELSELLERFTDFTNPGKTTCDDVDSVVINNNHFVLTGEFEYGSRSDVEAYIVSNGGIVDGNVKKSTNYVVVGALGSQAWKNGNYGGKIKKAIELRDKGIEIDIIEESDFFSDKKRRIVMEQIDLFRDSNKSWMDVTQSIIDKISLEEELPDNSLRLAENRSQDQKKITSCSVVIATPDYPKGVNTNNSSCTSLFNIQTREKNGETELLIGLSDTIIIGLQQLYPAVNTIKRKSDPLTRVVISANSKDFSDIIESIIRTAFEIYFSKGGSAFGCCHLYEECSDAKKCLHENKLYARGCAYYHNLKNNRIFYGKNRNI